MKSWVLRFREVDRHKFKDVQTGRKTVETRAGGGRFDAIQPGDVLEMRCGGETCLKSVTKVKKFGSIAELLSVVPRQNVMPWAGSDEEVAKTYNSFPGYAKKIANHGVVAFWLADPAQPEK